MITDIPTSDTPTSDTLISDPPSRSGRSLAANRRNAQKSCGPKTAAGKSRSSRNALRHGVTAKRDVLPDEDRAEHDRFCAGIVAGLAAEGPLERQYAQLVA